MPYLFKVNSFPPRILNFLLEQQINKCQILDHTNYNFWRDFYFYQLQISNNIEKKININPDISWSYFGSIITAGKKTICTSADRLSTNFSIAFWRLTRINKWQWNIFICQWNGLTLVSSWRRTQGGSIWWLVLGKPQRKKNSLLNMILSLWKKNTLLKLANFSMAIFNTSSKARPSFRGTYQICH